MWLGTEDGLNKYDGYKFKVYKNDPENPYSLSYNYIKAIHEDKSGALWIGTYGGGINKFDREKERFIYFKARPNNSNSLSNNFINFICEDHAGALWIGTENGLNKFDRKKEQFIHYKADPDDPNSLSNNRVMSIYEDRRGVLWIGTHGGGLNKLIPGENEGSPPIFIHYQYDSKDSNSLSSNRVMSIYEDRRGVLWIGTHGGGLNKLIPGENEESPPTFIRYQYSSKDPNSLSNNSVNSLYEDRYGTLWVGTDNGLDKLIPGENEGSSPHFIHYKTNPNDPHSLSYNKVFSVYEDRSGVLWIGTHVGANKLDQEKKQFDLYRARPNDPNSLSHNFIYAICEDKAGALWIGTQGGGLNKLVPSKKEGSPPTFIHYKADPNDPDSLSINNVRAINTDRSGTLWVGTQGAGLDKLVPRKKEGSLPTFIHYRADPNDPDSLSNDVVRAIFEDSAGVLWIGTEDGLNRFDRKKEQFIRYKADPDDPDSLSNSYIYVIFEDRSGVLWIGTLDGLNKFDRKKERFIRYMADPSDPNSLSNSEILSIYEDSSSVFWVGTPGGLNKFDRTKETSVYYMEKDGLPNDLIYDILEDNNGNLWLSTNKGIAKFNPQTESFRNYDVKDGLQSNEFCLGACHKGRDGQMFFGGINGINAFYPDNIKDNPHIPLIVLTEFQISNKSVPIGGEKDGHPILTKSITETEEIELSHEDRVISFEFAALHYTSPGKNQYAYMMEGFEKNWNYVGNRRFATYTNLPPGDYVFRVKGSNNDGVWNEEGVSLKITIKPPFWLTWWFRGLVVIIVLLLFITVYNVRTHTIRERAKELEKHVEERAGELKVANSELQQEIIERKRAEESLQAEKAYIDQLFESAQEAIIMADNNHRVRRINSEFTRLFGYTREEAIGRSIDVLVSSGDLRKEAASYTKKVIEGKKFAFESVRQRKDGKLIHVSVIGSPIIIGNKQVGYYAIYRDITERKRAEEAVKRRAAQAALIYKVGQRVSSELELQMLLSEIVNAIQEAFNYYGVMLLLLDEEGKCLSLKSITGGHAKIMPKDLSVAIGEGMIGNAAATGKTHVSGDVRRVSYYVRVADEKTNSELTVPIKRGDKIVGVLDIQSDRFDAFDETDVAAMETLSTQIAAAIENARLYEKAQQEITDRKRAEAQLNVSLKEKEVLLKEIHHRVKNNMQIISSLLRLQAWSIKDEKMQDMFKVSQDRIKSMALIHEKLYQSEDLARIHFSDYIRSLTKNLFSIYRAGKDNVTMKFDMEEFYLDINTAIPLGLIINELVSNSLKYAFPEGRTWGDGSKSKSKGIIYISLHSDNEGHAKLVVSDNGVGLPKDFDFNKIESLGLQLVNDLVDQIDGTMKLERRGGTAFNITFNVPQ